jgi:O-antigen/teichoic acid export membrane protein
MAELRLARCILMSTSDKRESVFSAIQAESPLIKDSDMKAPEPGSSAKTFTRNSILSVSRLFVTSALAFLLSSYLTHRLPVKTYSAWVLILQVSAYVSYLEFGIQSGIAKYVAEYDARNDAAGAGMRASAGLALMLIASALGVVLTLILAWQVPNLFHEMPALFYRDVRLGIICVGVSISFGLLCSIFSSIFIGLQRYAAPTLLALVNRILFTAMIILAVALHQSLAVMGMLVAVVNVITGLLQFEAWRRWARRIRLSLRGLDSVVMRKMTAYCSSLAAWTAGMLFISGLDVTIVGKYDFSQTAFYAVAIQPTNLIIAIMAAALAPLMSTASALSVHRSPSQMGAILLRMTRYATLLLAISAAPLLVGGYWALRAWVGPVYATHAVEYLRILILANCLRNICVPYASMLIATNSQRIAIFGVIAEAVVNVASSVYLARHIGAIGVAYGTLIGSFVSVGMHFALNMRYTMPKFTVPRLQLLVTGVIRPCALMVPSLCLATRWWTSSAPSFDPGTWIIWGLSTLLLAWFVGLNGDERGALLRLASRRLNARAIYN